MKGAIRGLVEKAIRRLCEWKGCEVGEMTELTRRLCTSFGVKKICQDGRVLSKAILVVLGVNMEGCQEVLGLYIYETELASVWMEVLNDLRSRGVKDILYICSDNLQGLDKSVEAVYPPKYTPDLYRSPNT